MRWILGAFGFLVTTAYWPQIHGAGTTPRWAVITLFLAIMIWRHMRMTPAHWVGLAFVGWALLSLTWTATPLDSIDAALKLLALAGLFMVGSTLNDLTPVYVGAALGIGVNSALVIADLAGLIEYQQYSRPSGLFVNGLYLAEAAAMVLVACLAGEIRIMRIPLWPLCLPSLIFVHLARGPILATASALILLLWRRSRRYALGLALIAIAGLSAMIWLRPETITLRFALWSDALHALTWRGTGLGSYFGIAPFISDAWDAAAHRELHVHNAPLELLVELGPVGLILAVAFIMLIFRASNDGSERLVLIVFLIEGLFGFNNWLPATGGLAAIVAGQIMHRACQ